MMVPVAGAGHSTVVEAGGVPQALIGVQEPVVVTVGVQLGSGP